MCVEASFHLHASSGHFRMSSLGGHGRHFPAQGGKGPSHALGGESLVSVLSLVAEPGTNPGSG